MNFFEMVHRLETGAWIKARAENWRHSQAYITLESREGNKKLLLHHRDGATNYWQQIDSVNLFNDIYEEAG